MMWWLRVLLVVCVLFNYFEDSFGIHNSRFKRQDLTSDSNWITEVFNNCSCVLYYQCDDDGFIITNGKSLFNVRSGLENDSEDKNNRIICNGGKYQGEVICCYHRAGEEFKDPITTPSSNISTASTTAAPIFKRRKTQCGKSRPHINVRFLLGDDELTPLDGEFPWLASIYKKDKSSTKWKHHKSGSLIHPKVILTGSHVVGRAEPSELKVIVNGRIELSQIGDDKAQERNVAEIIKHPEYSSGTLHNDVALLILQEPYNSSEINTICLRPEIAYENKRCLVAGWGKKLGQHGTFDILLKKVELPTHSHSRCEEMLQKTRLGVRYKFHESLMCAGGEEGKDACTGDGGSPLICPSGQNDSMYQVGLVAYGIGCGLKDVPGVYANVGHFHSWMVAKLKEYDINI